MRVLFLLFVLFWGSCSHAPKEKIRLGIDTSWATNEQTPYIIGFIDELLIDVARDMRVEFVKVPMYSKHDVALSTLPPYTFNKAKYDFSQNIFRTGPVLVIPTEVKTKKLTDMKGDTLGIVAGMDVTQILQKYPDILVRSYPTTTELIGAVVAGEVQGALLNRLEAVGYTSGLYNGTLKIASLPLNDAGLHMIAEKGKHERFVRSFDNRITELKKKKFYRDLLEKWKL